MLHIAWPFYTKELRQLIKQLKAEGKLREEPLWELDKIVVLYLLFMPNLFFVSMYFFDVAIHIRDIFIITIISIAAIAYIVRQHIEKFIIPYSIGSLKQAIITSDVSYNYFSIPDGRGWFFYFRLIDNNLLDKKEYFTSAITKKYMPTPPYSRGQQIKVLIHPTNTKSVVPYFSPQLRRWCLDTTRFTKNTKGK